MGGRKGSPPARQGGPGTAPGWKPPCAWAWACAWTGEVGHWVRDGELLREPALPLPAAASAWLREEGERRVTVWGLAAAYVRG